MKPGEDVNLPALDCLSLFDLYNEKGEKAVGIRLRIKHESGNLQSIELEMSPSEAIRSGNALVQFATDFQQEIRH